eukprot:9281092-Pyramimonas_sp.AAC.1
MEKHNWRMWSSSWASECTQKGCVNTLTDLVENNTHNVGTFDPLAIGAASLTMNTSKQKRRRTDDDFKSAVMHSAMRKGMAATPQGYARSQLGLNDGTVADWIPRHMAEYKASL